MVESRSRAGGRTEEDARILPDGACGAVCWLWWAASSGGGDQATPSELAYFPALTGCGFVLAAASLGIADQVRELRCWQWPDAARQLSGYGEEWPEVG